MKSILLNIRFILMRVFMRLFFSQRYREVILELEKVRLGVEKKDLADQTYQAQKLRQAAHILEKGMRTEPWKEGRGKEWYQKAVELQSQIVSEKGVKDPSLDWASEIIENYKKAQESQKAGLTRFPWEYSGEEKFEVLMNIIKNRRSIRHFQEKDVETGKLEKVIASINWAPNSCNKQTAKVYCARDPALVEKCLSTSQGATGFGENIPVFLSFCSDLRAYSLPKEMQLPLIDASLGIQNSCLVAHSLDLSLVLLSWANHTREDDKKLRSLLNIPDHFQIVVNGVLGYPAYDIEAPGRKSVTQTLKIISIDSPN